MLKHGMSTQDVAIKSDGFKQFKGKIMLLL